MSKIFMKIIHFHENEWRPATFRRCRRGDANGRLKVFCELSCHRPGRMLEYVVHRLSATLMIKRTFNVLLALAATAAVGSTASAETVYGLAGTTAAGFSLFSFDSATPGVSTSVGAGITNLTAGTQLVGMDYRPATRTMYAIGYNTTAFTIQLYSVNVGTAALTAVGATTTVTGLNGSNRFGFDFNPVVDRIRVTHSSGANFRLNPNDGTVAGTDTALTYDASTGSTGIPAIYGAAYSSNFVGAASTTLYGYDYRTDQLTTVGGINGAPSPNGGLVFNIGDSGVISGSGGLDIDISAAGAAFGVLDNEFYTVNLATGAFTSAGLLTGRTDVLDIAAVPEPSTYVLVAVVALGGVVLRRRRLRVC